MLFPKKEPEKRWCYCSACPAARGEVRGTSWAWPSIALSWQRQLSSTLGCTGISSSSRRGVIQPLYPTLVRPIWSAVSSCRLPSRHKDLWNLPVLGDAQKQNGTGKILSNLLKVTLLWAGRLHRFQRSQPQPFRDSVPLIAGQMAEVSFAALGKGWRKQLFPVQL